MILKDVTPNQILQFFLNDLKLVRLSLSDEEIWHIYEYRTCPWHEHSVVKGIFDEHRLVGLIKYERFSNIAINAHMYISSALHHSKQVKNITDLVVYDYLMKVPQTKKVLLTVPKTCNHIHKFVKRYGFKQEADISDCIVWRQKPTDLVIYSLDTNIPGDII